MDKTIIKKVFERNDSQYSITFETKEGELMVNATQMGKVFGENKKPVIFLRNKGVRAFINELKKENGENSHRSYISEPYIINGDEVRPSLRGTWMHEKLAMRYAMWLSPKFHLWVVNQIMELLKTGSVELNKPKMQQLQQHLDLQTQRDNTKEVTNRIYTETKGDVKQIPLYHHKSLLAIMGCGKKDIMEIAKMKGLSKKITSKGAKEVIRTLYPEKACVMSMVDNIIAASDNFRLDDQSLLIDTVKRGESMFDGLIKLGVNPVERK